MGDEGGFAPSINSTTEGLDLIVAAISARPVFALHSAHHDKCLKPSTVTTKGLTSLWLPSRRASPALCVEHTMQRACMRAKLSPLPWQQCECAPEKEQGS